jgi:hypothetical protein
VLVRKGLSTRNPAEASGYAVALPGDAARDGGPVWFGGGKLAADLTLPKLRRRWEPARVEAGEKFTAQERDAFWELAAQTAADASAQIRSHAATSPAAAADAAWAAADTLHAVAAALGSRVLRQAANSARTPYGRIPGPTPAGNRLRRAARLLAASAAVSGDSTLAVVTLVTRLAALAEAVAELRDVQQRAAQAASARRAAERLRASRAAYASWTPTARARGRHARRADPPRIPLPAGLATAGFRSAADTKASTAKSPRLTQPWLSTPAWPRPLTPGSVSAHPSR